MDRGGLVGADGATHCGAFDVTYMATLPNMIVMAPSDEAELIHMVRGHEHLSALALSCCGCMFCCGLGIEPSSLLLLLLLLMDDSFRACGVSDGSAALMFD